MLPCYRAEAGIRPGARTRARNMMMTPPELLSRAERLGLKVEARANGKLRVTPADRCPDEFAQLLRDHKSALLAWLSSPPNWCAVPPADLPLNLAVPALTNNPHA